MKKSKDKIPKVFGIFLIWLVLYFADDAYVYIVKKKLSFSTKLCYGIGNLGYGSTGQTVSSFVMFFATSVLGLSGFLVGAMIAITSLWDGLSDPLVGYLSDRTKNKFFGRRLGHMLFATFALALCNFFLWLCPFSGNGAAAWLLIFLLLQETFNTFFATPYSALCIDIAPDYNDQTKMQGFKTVFYIIGLILPSILMSVLMPAETGGQFDRQGYINIALVNSALVIVCGLVSIFGSLKRVRSMPGFDQAEHTEKLQTQFLQKTENQETKNLAKKETQIKDIKNPEEKNQETENQEEKQESKKERGFSKIMAGYVETFKKKNFRTVMLGYSVSLIASVFITSVGMHLFTYCFHFSSQQISALMTCLFGGAILSQFLWVNVVKKYDKKQTLIFALCVMLFGIAMTSITFLFRTFTTADKIFFFVLPCLFVCGIGSGALYSLPHSMYADVVTMEQYETGVNNAGRYTGYYTFTYNFSNSIALLFIGLLLDLVKFDSSMPVQSLAVQTGLGRIVFFGSAIALTIAIIIFSKYSIKRSDVLKVQIKEYEKKDGIKEYEKKDGKN